MFLFSLWSGPLLTEIQMNLLSLSDCSEGNDPNEEHTQGFSRFYNMQWRQPRILVHSDSKTTLRPLRHAARRRPCVLVRSNMQHGNHKNGGMQHLGWCENLLPMLCVWKPRVHPQSVNTHAHTLIQSWWQTGSLCLVTPSFFPPVFFLNSRLMHIHGYKHYILYLYLYLYFNLRHIMTCVCVCACSCCHGEHKSSPSALPQSDLCTWQLLSALYLSIYLCIHLILSVPLSFYLFICVYFCRHMSNNFKK